MISFATRRTRDGCVRNCFSHGRDILLVCTHDVVPEIDQLKVGLCLLPFGDPYVDFAQAAQLRARVLPTYDEMDKDADFCDLGSVMGMAYRELFHMEFRSGHYYLFLPKTTNGEILPCLIFLRAGRQRKSVSLGAVEVVQADQGAQ